MGLNFTYEDRAAIRFREGDVMARERWKDHLGSHKFLLFDISPNLNPPFFVLSPAMGAASVSGLSLEAETETIRALNSHYAVHYVTGATVGAITLTRGARADDTDFYRWVERAINGVDKFRRTLLLIQLMPGNRFPFGLGGDFSVALPGIPGVKQLPARTWVLWDSIPTSYTPGDLDATTAEITMMSLSIQPQAITEVASGTLL